ncbi:acyl-[acyl-carrier-protein] thioesterase [Anaeromyxobacter soli]|uniref:acyl-[acyl-carrier-protein] thioesterase n=1 Tax=Anaeromyxobacter soli TaxID=2922725 RepID=UPI001FAF5F14|nr:acyl-ACP thioesterase domain-containing protein [Anaeromyxobacter sp. SG29]
MQTHRQRFGVHTYEVDAFGTIAIAALSGYLQEVAGQHAAALGVGLDVLMPRGLTWVLARQRIENPVPIVLGDRLEIETWPAGIDRLAALRDFVVRRADGAEVARATTQWFVLDLATRRPVRPADVLDARFPREPSAPVLTLEPGRLPELREWEHQKRFHVRYGDIDVNMHVTNTSYPTWAQEVVPREVFRARRLADLEVQFLAEAHYGSAILSRLAPAGEGRYAHAIVREEDEKELARLVTRWVPRPEAILPAAR